MRALSRFASPFLSSIVFEKRRKRNNNNNTFKGRTKRVFFATKDTNVGQKNENEEEAPKKKGIISRKEEKYHTQQKKKNRRKVMKKNSSPLQKKKVIVHARCKEEEEVRAVKMTTTTATTTSGAQHTWRDVANEYLPHEVAEAISTEDPKRFERLIESLATVASLEKLSTRPSSEEEEEETTTTTTTTTTTSAAAGGDAASSLVFDITSLLRSHLVSKPFRATRDVRVIVTLVKHCFAVVLADNEMRIDLKTRTKWANLAKTTLSVFEDQLDEVLEIDWKPIMDKVNHVSQGEVNEYYGPVVLAEWRSTISALARASRRYFKLGSSEEIWEASKKNLENIWSEECFTSLAFMVAFLPTRHLRNKKGNEEDVKFYKRMIEGENGDWNRLFDALPSSVFWKSGFLQLFSQCAKHDVSGRIQWSESLDAKIYSAALWSFQLSSSNNGGGRSGGRNGNNGSKQSQHLQVLASSVRSIGSPATKIAPRVLDTAHRARSIAKFLAFRSLNYTATKNDDNDERNNNTDIGITSSNNRREKLFDFLEHCLHPDSPGSDALAWFLEHFVAYLEKAKYRAETEETVGLGPFTGKQDEELTKMALIADRLCSKAIFSRHGHTKHVAVKSVGKLCYICPKHTIYAALSRFENTLQHEDSSHQISTAIEALAMVTRSMLVNIDPNEIFVQPEHAEALSRAGENGDDRMEVLDEVEGYSTGAFIVSALEATLPCIDVNDAAKTNAALKFYTILLSSVSNLIDPGEENCVPQLPVVWSDWTLEVLERVFAVLEHAQPETSSNNHGASSGGVGESSEQSASFLMNANCMFTPMFRTLLIRLPEESRKLAIRKIARFIFTNTLPSATRELGILVSSVFIASPKEATKEIFNPMFDMLSLELNEAQLDAKRSGELSKARINRLSYIVGVISLGFDRAHTTSLATLKDKVVQSSRRLFALAESARSNPILYIAGPLLCRYCLALGNVIDQLDAQQSVTQDDEAIKKGKRQYADWVALRWKVSRDDTSFGPPDIEARKKLCLPKPFNWANEEDHRIKNEVLREIIEEFLIKSSSEMTDLFEGCATAAIQNMDINDSPEDSSSIDPRSISPKSTSQVTIIDRSRRSPSPPAAAGLTATALAPSSSSGNSPTSLQKRQSLAEIAKVSKIGSIGQFSSLNDMEDYNCRRHRVRSLAARIGAVATGLTARIPDFNEGSSSADLAIHGEMPGSLVFDVQTRHAAAEALSLALENHESDDAVTLTIVARVAEEILSPSNSTYHAAKAAMRAWVEDSASLRMPHPGRKKKNVMLGAKIPELYPRWLVYEYTRIKHHWRRAQAVYFRESSGEYCSSALSRQNSSCVRLLAALRSCAINNTYVSVRAAARNAIETDLERYPKEAPRVVESSADSLMIPEENEDRCRAACEVLKTNSSIVATTQTSSESLLKFTYALLQARCIHDTVISQQAVSETFVNFAARFSRRSMDLLNYSIDGPTPLMNDLVKFIFHPPDERAKHWSFQSMATAFFMFTLVSDCSDKSVRNATRIFLEGLTSDSRPTWLPSACGLLLVSRYKNFDEQMLVDAVNTDFENTRELSEKLLYSFAAARGEDTNRDIGDRAAGGQQSRSALLAQAGESLYGVGHELAGPFPKVCTRAMEGIATTPGVFITVFSRLWEMLFKARPSLLRETVDDVIEEMQAHDDDALSMSSKKKKSSADESGRGGSISPGRRKKPNTNFDSTTSSASVPALDNTAISARAEAIAAAVRLCDEKATDLLLRKTRGNTSDISRETWLRALAFSLAERSDKEHFNSMFLRMIEKLPLTSASMLSQMRRLESIAIFVAESARYTLGDHVECKMKLIEEMKDVDGSAASSPFVHDSQGVRSAGAHVTAKLISLNRNAARFNINDDQVSANEAKLRGELDAFVGDFLASRVDAETEIVIGGDEVAKQNDASTSGASSSAMASAAAAAVAATTSGEEVSEEVKRARRFLETIFTTTKLLILMGDIMSISDLVPTLIRSALLCAENTSDLHFGSEAKSCLIALRSVLFTENGGNSSQTATLFQDIIDTALLPSMKSSFWKTRKQSAYFASAFAFRHMFVLDEGTQIDALQKALANELLEDPRVEVREAARDSLFAFLSGKRREAFTAQTESKFIERFSSSSVSASLVASLPRDQVSLVKRHAVILALSALLHSSSANMDDTDLPEWLKKTIILAAQCSFDSDPIKECARKAFAELKKKLHHKEKFEKFKRAFSEQEWDDVVSVGFEYNASYMV